MVGISSDFTSKYTHNLLHVILCATQSLNKYLVNVLESSWSPEQTWHHNSISSWFAKVLSSDYHVFH